MKFSFHITTRVQIISSFAIVAIVVIVVGLIGITGISRMTNDLESIYHDRLYPAVEMAKITEKLYENRLGLEEILLDSVVDVPFILKAIHVNNLVIDSLTERYLATHLTSYEKTKLMEYQEAIFKYRQIENKIIENYKQNNLVEAFNLFSKQSNNLFRKAIDPIHDMTDEQTRIGNQLYKSSQDAAFYTQGALYTAIIVVILISIVIGTWFSFQAIN